MQKFQKKQLHRAYKLGNQGNGTKGTLDRVKI